MNDYFKSRTECFLYLKALYTFAKEYDEEYGDILSLDDYDISPEQPRIDSFWYRFINLPNVPKINDTEFFFFSFNLLLLNKEDLEDNSINEPNFEIPEKKEYTCQFEFRQRTRKSGSYSHSFETFAELEQVEKSLDEISEDWREYYNQDWVNNSDSEFTEMDLKRVHNN
jgi:hypothetical protein